MTDKQFVRSVYPEANLVRWCVDRNLIAIYLERRPPNYLWVTYGWYTYKDTRAAWRYVRQEITKRMLQKFEE